MLNRHAAIVKSWRHDTPTAFDETETLVIDIHAVDGYGCAKTVDLGIKCKANIGKIAGMDRDDYAYVTLKHEVGAALSNHIAGAEVTGTADLPLRDSRVINFCYPKMRVDDDGKIRLRVGKQIRHSAARSPSDTSVHVEVVVYLNGGTCVCG